MRRCCSVSGCKSNYRSTNETVSTFSLPKCEELKNKWLRNIPTDFTGIKNPIVCVKHFKDSDVIRIDKCLVNGELKEFPRTYPKLKEGALPTIFPNVPNYLSPNSNYVKRLPDVEQEHLNLAIKQSILDHKKHSEERKVSNLDDVQRYFKQLDKNIKARWAFLTDNNKVVFCLINTSNDLAALEGCVTIKRNLAFQLFIGKNEIPLQKLPKHVQRITSFNVLDDLLNIVENGKTTLNENTKVDLAIELLKSIEDDHKQSKFFIEQLKLLKVAENVRRYENKTILFAATLYIASSSAYFSLYKCKYLFLPHPRNLTRLISSFSLNKSTIQGSIEYLKSKRKFLKEHKFIVNILSDEIYIDPSLNFKGGTVYGYSESNQNKVAKTAQVFMVSSIFSKYKDVVSIIPVSNLTAMELKAMILNVLLEVEKIGFKVIALISDNNVINRKAFELFTVENVLRPSVPHPVDGSRQLFFVFDTVHIVKCIRNNWITKKTENTTISFPDMNSDKILKAQFKHLEVLYQYEKNSIVKYSNLLSYKALYPSNIQKQNVKLALQVFSEKNVAALKCIAETNASLFPGFSDTCTFLEIFIKWWKIVNVKSVFEGERFNDVDRKAIKAANPNQIIFLEKMATWLKLWRFTVPASDSLTYQTFQAIINTN